MRRHRPTCLSLVCALAVAGGGAVAAPQTIAANRTAPREVPQSGGDTGRVVAALKDVKLPPGFRIDVFARVPDARDMAVSADGRKVFVGTNGDEAYVLDLRSTAGPATSVKTFAPSIAKTMPHGVCFGADGTLYLAELNRILAFPDAAAKAESPDLSARVVVPQGRLIPPQLSRTAIRRAPAGSGRTARSMSRSASRPTCRAASSGKHSRGTVSAPFCG